MSSLWGAVGARFDLLGLLALSYSRRKKGSRWGIWALWDFP